MSVARAERLTADERREMIIDAAMIEFAIRGLHGTTTQTIAERVGVSQPYIFHLFETKKKLFIEAVERGFGRVLEQLRQAALRADGNVLMAMAVAYESLLTSDRTLLLGQMQAYAACDDPEVREVVREGFARIYRFVQAVSAEPEEELRHFFAMGMLMNVAAAMDLAVLDEDWATVCLGKGLES